MIGPFWRTRRLWGSYDPRLLQGESTDGEFPTAGGGRRATGRHWWSFPRSGRSCVRPAPRTPGPGAAWSGGRL